MREELDGRTYHPSRSVCFVVKQPKFREIFAADFRDRVVYHVLVDVLERIWEPIFIHDSYACRKDKGTHRAVRRLQRFMRRVTHNGTKPGFALQLDIRGFFFHIDKEILYQIIATRIRDEALLWLARTIIVHDCTEHPVFKTDRRLWRHIPPHKTLFGTENRRGLPIGNLTSQFFSNVYLNELDQFVKHHLKARLRDSERKLVQPRPGYTLFRHDPATLARMRATWASYRAHLKMANTYRLWDTLVNRSGWVRHFFVLEGGLLVPRVAVPPLFRRFRDQYRFFAERFPDLLLLVQVGGFDECYDEQAERVSRVLKLRLLAGGRGFRVRCGVPVRLGSRCIRALVTLGIPVALVRESADHPWFTGVKPRGLVAHWEPVKGAIVHRELLVRAPRQRVTELGGG